MLLERNGGRLLRFLLVVQSSLSVFMLRLGNPLEEGVEGSGAASAEAADVAEGLVHSRGLRDARVELHVTAVQRSVRLPVLCR